MMQVVSNGTVAATNSRTISVRCSTLGVFLSKSPLCVRSPHEDKCLEWHQTRWTQIVQRAHQKQALLHIGGEARYDETGYRATLGPPGASIPKCPPAVSESLKRLRNDRLFLRTVFLQDHSGRLTLKATPLFCAMSCRKPDNISRRVKMASAITRANPCRRYSPHMQHA